MGTSWDRFFAILFTEVEKNQHPRGFLCVFLSFFLVTAVPPPPFVSSPTAEARLNPSSPLPPPPPRPWSALMSPAGSPRLPPSPLPAPSLFHRHCGGARHDDSRPPLRARAHPPAHPPSDSPTHPPTGAGGGRTRARRARPPAGGRCVGGHGCRHDGGGVHRRRCRRCHHCRCRRLCRCQRPPRHRRCRRQSRARACRALHLFTWCGGRCVGEAWGRWPRRRAAAPPRRPAAGG